MKNLQVVFISVTAMFLCACTNSGESLAGSLLKLEVDSVAVAKSFTVYMGGGTNISPPSTLPDSGGGIPMISISKSDDGTASSFFAGEIKATKENFQLIKIECMIKNPSQKPQPFRVGDVSLVIGSTRDSDFVAVGLGSEPCAMSDADRKIVKKKTIDIPPSEQRVITYVFALASPAPKQGGLSLGNSAPISFEIKAAPKE